MGTTTKRGPGRPKGSKNRKRTPNHDQSRATLAAVMPTAINAWRRFQEASAATQKWIQEHPELAALQKAELDAMAASNEVGLLVDRLAREMTPERQEMFFAHMRESKVADAIGVLAVDWKPEERA